MNRWRLSSKQREQLYNREAEKARELGKGDFPLCNICLFPILPGRQWDQSHDPTKPRWLNGMITGIAHRKCNQLHNNRHDSPLFAKSERVRKRFFDFTRSRTPLPGGRDDGIRKKLDGTVVSRETRLPWRGR